MTRAVRRYGIGLGALVEAGLVLWLVGGFLPAGVPLGLVTIALGYLTYRDILRREPDASPSTESSNR